MLRLVLFLTLVFAAANAVVELPCRFSDDESCHISRLKGDFTNETVEIQIPHTKKTTKVTIEDVKLGSLPATFFRTFKQLEILTINRCGLTNLTGLRGLRTLQQLYLNGNKLTEIGERQLSPGLVFVEAKNNRIKVVHKNAFKTLENLYWVDLAHNRIKKLPKKLFSSSITSINLQDNRVKDIEKVFRKHDKIKYLNLASNRVEKITAETFQGLVNLKELDLSDNEISEAAIAAFDTLRSLKLLKLSRNRLKELIFAIPSQILSVLYVDHNELEALTIFSNQEKLAGLSLAANNNRIATLRLQAGLPVISCSLQDNRISDLEPIGGLKHLEKLNLANNDLSRANFSALPPSINNLSLQNTTLSVASFEKVLELKHLIFSLNVANNPGLSSLRFGNPSPSPVAVLRLNGCGVGSFEAEDLKKTFRNLKEVHLGDSKCEDLPGRLLDGLKMCV